MSEPAPIHDKVPSYEPLLTPADLAFASVQLASQELGPANLYRLYVSRVDMDSGLADQVLATFRRQLRDWNRFQVLVNMALPPHCWYLEANGRQVGSWVR